MKYREIAGMITLIACQAHAETTTSDMSAWTLRAGVGTIQFDSRSSVELPTGSAVPGAAIGVENNTTVGLDVVYQFAPRWRTHLAFGIPPTTTLRGEGTLGAFVQPNGPLTGVLGKVQYAPLMWTATYSLGNLGGVEPYVGAGINYTWVVKSSDGDLAGLSVKSAWGTTVQAGVNIPIDGRWSAFLDARKVFVKTSASGTAPALGGLPASAEVTLNPLIVVAGVSYRF